MSSKKIVILCTGVALGAYIPGMLVNYQLRKKGYNTEVVVIENLFIDEKRNKINEHKKAFHNSFSVALTGQKIVRDLRPNIDDTILLRLFERWKEENDTIFIVFSGFWITILEEFRNFIYPMDIWVDCCHMDSDISASWKNVKSNEACYNYSWIFSWSEKDIIQKLDVNGKAPIPFEQRRNSVVIHGGGWGMGTYKSKIPELQSKGINLDIVAYDIAETLEQRDGNRYFMVDPTWSPWFKDDKGEHEFPPFGQVINGTPEKFCNKEEYHEIYDVISLNKAIVSKPGGATMVDSFASATPLVMLEPFGNYELKNSELWEHLGFGIPYEKWKDEEFSFDAIFRLHKNILESQIKYKNYVQNFIEKMGNRFWKK